ncbi:MAG: wax ester/triacylglycerol synthase family O-acyltransferase [Acidimicrobiales bacterium]
MWYIEGLQGRRGGHARKVHHAAMDGAIESRSPWRCSTSPNWCSTPAGRRAWEPDKVPSEVEMLGYAMSSLARQPLRVLKALRRTGQAALDVRNLTRQPGHDLAPLPFTAPATSINGACITPRAPSPPDRSRSPT